MNKSKHKLIERYLRNETSLDEEIELKVYFESNKIHDEHTYLKPYFEHFEFASFVFSFSNCEVLTSINFFVFK